MQELVCKYKYYNRVPYLADFILLFCICFPTMTLASFPRFKCLCLVLCLCSLRSLLIGPVGLSAFLQ